MSNLSGYTAPTFNVGDASNHGWATAFTTGSASGGYTLNSVTAKFHQTVGVAPADNIVVKIHANSSGVPATNAVTTLSGSNPGAVGDDYTYTCSSNCVLTAGTTYHLAISAEVGNDSYSLAGTAGTKSDNQTNTPANAGWSIGDNSSKLASGTWTASSDNPAAFSVTAAVNTGADREPGDGDQGAADH